MTKLTRDINKEVVENSKAKTMQFVMDSINEEKVPWYSFLLSYKAGLVMTASTVFLLILGLVIINNPSTSPVIYALNEESSETIAEMSYMASHLVAIEFDLNDDTQTGLVFLSNENETEFETNIDEFSTYFNMLKAYFNEDSFKDSVTFNELDSDIYDVEILFTIDEIAYRLLLVQTSETEFEGIMEVDGVAFDVIGTITSENNETKFGFSAINGDDSVDIDYTHEDSATETKKTYMIQSRNNFMVSEKEVTLKIEDEEMKVEINENGNYYELKQELENNQFQYKLQYQINGQEGEVVITEEQGSNGQMTYNYQIKENGVEKAVRMGQPDFVDKDPNSNSSGNNGNNDNQSNNGNNDTEKSNNGNNDNSQNNSDKNKNNT